MDNREVEVRELKELVVWTRRYARSRTLSFLIQWCLIFVAIFVISLIAGLTQQSYISGNRPLFYISIFFLSGALVLFGYISISRWTTEVIWQITTWLYGKEGIVSLEEDEQTRQLPRWVIVLIGLMFVYHVFGALLISFRYLSLQYIQPYSAVGLVPVLCILIYYQRLGFWAWFWPLLYGLHAVLLVFGFPISFPRQWYLLNIILPVFGYGLVAIVVGHIYSRYALYKVKKLSREGLAGTSTVGNGDAENCQEGNE